MPDPIFAEDVNFDVKLERYAAAPRLHVQMIHCMIHGQPREL